MKTNIHTLLSLVLLFLLSSCATERSHRASGDHGIDDGYSTVNERNSARNPHALKPNDQGPSNRTLADMVSNLPGVVMAGREGSYSFKVRGAESLYSGSLPLFVLNGRSVGTDFNQINNTVDPNMVSSVRVLSGADAAIYGSRGSNGVIVIKTKRVQTFKS